MISLGVGPCASWHSPGEKLSCAPSQLPPQNRWANALSADFSFSVDLELHSEATERLACASAWASGESDTSPSRSFGCSSESSRRTCSFLKVLGKSTLRICLSSAAMVGAGGIYLAPGRPAPVPVRSKFVIGTRALSLGFGHLLVVETATAGVAAICPATHGSAEDTGHAVCADASLYQ